MKFYTLEKPNIEQLNPHELMEAVANIEGLDKEKKKEFDNQIKITENPLYLYWDKVKYKLRLDFFTPVELWFVVKMKRRFRAEQTPIITEKEDYFSWIKLDRYDEFFHHIDLHAGGELFSFKHDIDEKQKMKFVSRGLLEEAIASSQLEGASTSRKVAKKMIREGRKPENKSEQMILNNYQIMKDIEEEYKNKKLDIHVLQELHRKITYNTLDNPSEAGQFDTDEDRVAVYDEQGVILHQPPKMNFVQQELDRLIQFANDDLQVPHFVHPIVRAIMIHFWIGYLHPFGDGNGRLARVLFYWYLLRHGYWAFAYLPISKLIKYSRGQYKMAYICTEQDDNDLTYFVDYNIHIIQSAIQEFQQYINLQYQKNVQFTEHIGEQYNLNARQIELLQYFAENKDEKRTQIQIYKNIHQISMPTASSDLRKLEKLGFIARQQKGLHVYYYPTDKLYGVV